MLTIGKIKEIIKDLPDTTMILHQDPFSEFSYETKNMSIERGVTKIDHTTNDGENFYDSLTEDDFEDLLKDNPREEIELKKEYQQALILYWE